MRVLAQRYPELAAFTPDATLLEIKARFGVGSLEEVRELGRRRLIGAYRPQQSGPVGWPAAADLDRDRPVVPEDPR